MRTPSLFDNHVKTFCQEVVPGSKPLYVPIQSLTDKPLNECFSIVPEHVATHGGKQLIGWMISEWRSVLIEAELHAVWQRPDGTLIDITPKNAPLNRILFIPDSSQEYTGVMVDNIRKPLSEDPRIRRFCDSFHERFLELNKGDLADQYGWIMPSPEVAAKIRKIEQEGLDLERILVKTYGKR